VRGVPDSPARPGSFHRPPPKGGAALSVLPREDGGTTQDAFRRAESPASLRLIDVALQPHRPGTLRRRTGSSLRTAPLTARGATRAPIRSGTRLYAYLCRASSTRELPAHSRPHPKPGPFSGPSAVCASTSDGLLRARAPSYSLPCGALRSSPTDAYDRLLLPTASTTSTRASSATGISSRLAPRP